MKYWDYLVCSSQVVIKYEKESPISHVSTTIQIQPMTKGRILMRCLMMTWIVEIKMKTFCLVNIAESFKSIYRIYRI